MLKLISLTVCMVVLNVIHCKDLPATITRCAKSDPHFNDCFTKSLVAGYHEFAGGNKAFGLNSIDPLVVETLDLSGGEGVSLRQIYTNAIIKGLTNIKVTNMDADFKDDKCYLKMDNLWPEIVMDGDYALDGRILVLPINGHGKCHHIMRDLVGKIEMHCEKVKKDGKTFIHVKEFTMKFTPSVVVFDFKNIIPDNEKLSQEVLKTINENSIMVANELKPALEASFAVIYRQVYNGFFNKMPEEDLFLP